MPNSESINTIARDEVILLDQDLREVYADYGSANLYVLKRDPNSGVVDDVYKNYVTEPTYIKCKVLGLVTDHVEDEMLTSIGREKDPHTFSVKILKSTLVEQGYNTITPDDRILYNDCDMEIIAVRPLPVIGDYAVRFDVLARGEQVTLQEIDNGK